MFENFREKLHTVQQDFTSGIKTLSDKSKEVKVKRKSRTESTPLRDSAGVQLLNRYEDTWVTLHKTTKECARAAEAVDGEVVMLSAHWERRRGSLLELQEQLHQIPAFLTDIQSITAQIARLEADFEETEGHLRYLETLCDQCELQRLKHLHVLQLEGYKKKKRKELESFKAELDAEHTLKVLEMEHVQQAKLKERQKYFEEAFQQDMEHYLSTGYLQVTDRRVCPTGSMSSMEVNVDMLEQMDLTDVSDHEALDVFLNSAGDEDATSPGPGAAPDADVGLKVPGQKLKESSVSSSCTDSVSGITEGPDDPDDDGSDDGSEIGPPPLVQGDEEEVQADTALVALRESEEPQKNSDDSDTQTW